MIAFTKYFFNSEWTKCTSCVFYKIWNHLRCNTCNCGQQSCSHFEKCWPQTATFSNCTSYLCFWNFMSEALPLRFALRILLIYCCVNISSWYPARLLCVNPKVIVALFYMVLQIFSTGCYLNLVQKLHTFLLHSSTFFFEKRTYKWIVKTVFWN